MDKERLLVEDEQVAPQFESLKADAFADWNGDSTHEVEAGAGGRDSWTFRDPFLLPTTQKVPISRGSFALDLHGIGRFTFSAAPKDDPFLNNNKNKNAAAAKKDSSALGGFGAQEDQERYEDRVPLVAWEVSKDFEDPVPLVG